MRFYFEIVAQDTAAHEARLKIIEVAGQGWCDKCELSSHIQHGKIT
ncbi:MAG: hypothetical protein H0V39_07835 [Nitrosomonas sp.]|nr:hypothetical protein [Nitrosomonas sp.]